MPRLGSGVRDKSAIRFPQGREGKATDKRRLLVFQGDRFVLMALNCTANLDWRLAQLGLLVGKKAFLGTGGAFGPVHSLEAAPETGVAERPVAAAIARQLVQHV